MGAQEIHKLQDKEAYAFVGVVGEKSGVDSRSSKSVSIEKSFSKYVSNDINLELPNMHLKEFD